MNPGRRVSDEQWLALTTLTETDRPPEFPYIMQVILNRSRSKRYPADVFQVVRQRYQFSFFNSFQAIADEDELYRQVLAAKNPPEALDSVARVAAAAMAQLPPQCGILPPNVLNYWSPRSMRPAGAKPRWDWSMLQVFSVRGIEPNRFTFAALVAGPTP